MKKYFIYSFIMLCLIHPIFSQKLYRDSLGIGQELPDISFSYYLGKEVKRATLRELRGKYIIFDFWSIWCSSCIKAIPKMDSLQKQFGDRLQIILVTKNSKQEVEKLFSRIKTPYPQLPLVTSDSIFYDLFPHAAEPFHAWINEKGLVKYVTEGYNTTYDHVSKFINNNELNLSRNVKNEQLNLNNPFLFPDSSSIVKNLFSYSAIFKGFHEQTVSSGIRVVKGDSDTLPHTVRALNTPILPLYLFAFTNDIYDFEADPLVFRNFNRIIIESKNNENFFMPSDPNKIDEWKKQNLYSYELYYPGATLSNLRKLMQGDLNKYLNFSARIELRKINCLVLVRTDSSCNLKSKNTLMPPKYKYLDNGFSVQNMPLSKSLIKALTYVKQELTTPIIDGTGYYENVDLLLSVALSENIDSLRKEFRKFGLDLVNEPREVNMLVIYNKPEAK